MLFSRSGQFSSVRPETSRRWRVVSTIALSTSLMTMAAQAGATTGPWAPQGPGPIFDTDGSEGITTPVNRPAVGAVETIVAHPSTSNIAWIGAANGGIFRTNNAMAAAPTWLNQTPDHPSLSIGALELDPTDGTNNTLVAGIGTTSAFNSDGGGLLGILRTVDGGTTWTSLSSGLLGKSVSGVAPRGATIVVAIDKSDSNFITDLGIFRSTDSGANFTQVSGAGGSGLPLGLAFDLAGDPTDDTVLYAVVVDDSNFPAVTGGLYRSTNTGATWTKISDPTMDALIDVPAADVDLAVGNSNNLYAAICGGDGSFGGIFRNGSASTGTSWTQLDSPETNENGTIAGLHPGTQCGTHLSLVADPSDADVAFIGGDTQPDNGLMSVLPNSVGANFFTGRLYRIDAGAASGSQATPITHCMTALSGCAGSARTASGSAPHADSREMVFAANGQLMQTDDGGVYRHTLPNGTTGDWVSMLGDLPVTEQHDLAYDSVADVTISGNQDNGTSLQETFGDPLWRGVFGGDGGDVVVAENHPTGATCTGTPPCSTRYWSVQNQIAGERTVYDSTNTLQSSDQPDLTALGGAAPPGARFITPIAVHATTPSRIIVGAQNGVYESFDDLDSVVFVINELVDDELSGNHFAYGSVSDSEALYFGSGDLVYVRTTVGGATPVATDPDPASLDDITGIALDPSNGNQAFAVDPDEVFHTTNAGGTWANITGNLLSLDPGKLRAAAFIPDGVDDAIVVGTDRGAYFARSSSGFSTWAELGTDLPNAPLYELHYDDADDLLVAGTLGRGAWTLSAPLSDPGLLFMDGFESGDTSAWDLTAP